MLWHCSCRKSLPAFIPAGVSPQIAPLPIYSPPVLRKCLLRERVKNLLPALITMTPSHAPPLFYFQPPLLLTLPLCRSPSIYLPSFSWHSVICHKISKSAYFGVGTWTWLSAKWFGWVTWRPKESRKQQKKKTTKKTNKLVVHNFSSRILHIYTSPLQLFFHVFCCSFVFFPSHFWPLVSTLHFSWPSHRLTAAEWVWRTLAPFLSGWLFSWHCSLLLHPFLHPK